MLGLAVVAMSMSACSTSYDCSNTDVVDALVEQASNSGFITTMKDVPAEWVSKLAEGTAARNVVTLDANEEIQHFRCKANLEFREGARTVTSKDITYEVRKIEGENDFTLEWELENNGITNIDPIRMFAYDVQAPWKEAIEKQQVEVLRGQIKAQEEEARTWARAFAPDYAAKNPPLTFDRDALKKHADDFLASREAEPVMDQFHDIDGDGFLDYFAIVAKSEYDEGEFAEETGDDGQYTNTGGFMTKNYFFVAVTQPFNGFGLETSMTLRHGKVTTAAGEKVTGKYPPKQIASVAKAPANPIVGVSNSNGYIVVSLADGQAVTIEEFKPEKPLEQVQKDRLSDLEDRLTLLRENGTVDVHPELTHFRG